MCSAFKVLVGFYGLMNPRDRIQCLQGNILQVVDLNVGILYLLLEYVNHLLNISAVLTVVNKYNIQSKKNPFVKR